MESENLIRSDETAYRLDLTAAQLKIVHTALKSLYDDLGHEEHDVKQVVASVLQKLPGEHEIRAIDITHELGAVSPGNRVTKLFSNSPTHGPRHRLMST